MVRFLSNRFCVEFTSWRKFLHLALVHAQVLGVLHTSENKMITLCGQLKKLIFSAKQFIKLCFPISKQPRNKQLAASRELPPCAVLLRTQGNVHADRPLQVDLVVLPRQEVNTQHVLAGKLNSSFNIKCYTSVNWY